MPRRTPTDRLTLDWIAQQGWVGDLAERRTGRITRDFLGFADCVALQPATEASPAVCVAIQHTHVEKAPHRTRKVLASPQARLWALAGGLVLVIGWRTNRTCRIEDLTEQLKQTNEEEEGSNQ